MSKLKSKKPLISVVVNSHNEGESLGRCLASVQVFADELIVVDMESTDNTREVAAKFNAKIFSHKYEACVEKARNFAIGKASGRWILILDPDERIPLSLAKKLKEVVLKKTDINYLLIPRRNIIFRQWIKNTLWWPDYIVRFFKKGSLSWPKEIHKQPELKGNGLTLPEEARFAITHYNYQDLDQYLIRNKRYAEVQAKELVRNKNYVLRPKDLLIKPTEEFVSRYFNGGGYKDGLHGLVLAKLQEYSMFLVYAKVWERGKFLEKQLENNKIREMTGEEIYQLEYWRNRWFKENYRREIWFWPLYLIGKLREFLLKIR